jgi:hypothetical protein
VKISENPWLKMQKTAKKCKNSYVFDKKRGSKTSTLVENVRQINLFMQNKPNFPHFSLENDDFDKKQTQFKPNSNPIKANFGQKIRVAKPIQTQNKPNLSKNKANSNPMKAGCDAKQSRFEPNSNPILTPLFRLLGNLRGQRQLPNFTEHHLGRLEFSPNYEYHLCENDNCRTKERL